MTSKAKMSRGMREANHIVEDALPRICRRAIQLLDDPSVASSAQAQLVSILFRAAGMFSGDGARADKEPHEMTPDELTEAITNLERQAEEFAKRGGDDIFG